MNMSKSQQKQDNANKNQKISNWQKSGVYRFLNNYPYIFVFLLALFVYAQTVTFAYVQLDDYAIVDEILVGIGSFSNIFSSFTEGYGGNFYRPLQTFTFVIDMAIGGGSPWTFHLGNLLLHCFTVLAVYYLFKNMKYHLK